MRGTWLLSILDGHRRYAHVTGLRGDAVAPQILGMTKIVSDESLRRGLAHLAPTLKRCPQAQRAGREAPLARSAQWMDEALAQSTRQALSTGWILDADTTVKPLYGHQDGAQIRYTPTQPGRPSPVIHTSWIANLRRVLDAEVQNGKAHAARHSLPRLVSLLEGLGVQQRPRLVRADNAFGNEPVMAALEELGQADLSKLRQSSGVKALIERLWSSDDWHNVGGGYFAVETTLQLSGWRRARRVVVVRRALKASLAAEEPATGKRAKRQQSLQFARALPVKLWEYAVLVTNADYDLEAITSRPRLLSGVARLTQHAGQCRLLLTLTHAAGDQIKTMIANIRRGLDTIVATAPQWPSSERWHALVRYIIDRIIGAKPENHPRTALAPPAPALIQAGSQRKIG